MASQYVAGVAAQMLAREPRLTCDADRRHHAAHRATLARLWLRVQDAAGFGRIRPEMCVKEAVRPFMPRDLKANGEEASNKKQSAKTRKAKQR
jgi:hypothetical protein